MADNLDLDIQNNKIILNFTVGNRYSNKTSLYISSNKEIDEIQLTTKYGFLFSTQYRKINLW